MTDLDKGMAAGTIVDKLAVEVRMGQLSAETEVAVYRRRDDRRASKS